MLVDLVLADQADRGVFDLGVGLVRGFGVEDPGQELDFLVHGPLVDWTHLDQGVEQVVGCERRNLDH